MSECEKQCLEHNNANPVDAREVLAEMNVVIDVLGGMVLVQQSQGLLVQAAATPALGVIAPVTHLVAATPGEVPEAPVAKGWPT